MNHQENVIEIKHLNKSYGEVQAVKDLSFRVKNEESCFAFLGVNGAGKSTTISIICGQQKKDSGSVQIRGIDADKGKKRYKMHDRRRFSGQCVRWSANSQGFLSVLLAGVSKRFR